MRIERYILILLIVFLFSGCTFTPYTKGKYGEMVIDTWYNDKTLGDVRKKAENIDEIVSRKCTFLESKDNKYVFKCDVIYKEKGETVIPLSKNSKMKLYVLFIKEKGNKYDYKVYNSSSKKGVWKIDEYFDY